MAVTMLPKYVEHFFIHIQVTQSYYSMEIKENHFKEFFNVLILYILIQIL